MANLWTIIHLIVSSLSQINLRAEPYLLAYIVYTLALFCNIVRSSLCRTHYHTSATLFSDLGALLLVTSYIQVYSLLDNVLKDE